jgi:aminopeptidase N
MLYERGGRAAAAATLAKASHALPWTERRLGPQPRLRITFAQINSDRLAYSWPGIIWLPDNLAPSGLDVYVAHELAHQWFGGIVPTRNRQLEPFTGEAPSEVVSRLFRHALRPSRCPGMRLDLTRKAYGGCLYEAIYVDGANVLNMVRKRMGDGAFWRALRGYVRDNRFQPVGTHDVLDALRRASRANLDPLLHRRFPSIVP